MLIKLRSAKGFTLTEIMVALSILSILGALAVTNYRKYANKALQAEAQANLVYIYEGEAAFYTSYQMYITNLDVLGFRVGGVLNYAYGFSGLGPIATQTNYGTLDPTNYTDGVIGTDYGKGCYATNLGTSGPPTCIPAFDMTNSGLVPTSGFTSSSFPAVQTLVAFAASNLPGANVADTWSMSFTANAVPPYVLTNTQVGF